jgi:Lrp/AsnC family transcriptional regulator
MNVERQNLDSSDLRILNAIQRDGSQSQRELAERVGLSQNACWRRLQRLQQLGVIQGTRAQVNLAAAGLDLTVFVMVRTRHHSLEWSAAFRKHVERLPEVIDFYRIGGDVDYLIKVVTRGMAGYDAFYQKLIVEFDFESVKGIFAMEAILDNRAADLSLTRE